MRPPVIAGVSDVSIGYGSPQVPRLMQSLVAHYNAGEAYVLEPDQSERPPRHDAFPELKTTRLHTSVTHYARSGTIEYLLKAHERLERIRPDVLVISSPLTLPVLFKLSQRPKFVIYYMLESLSYYDQADRWQRLMLDANRAAGPKIDLILFPEENRARADMDRARFVGPRIEIVYNAVNDADAAERIVPASERNGKFIYSGTIEPGLTLAEYFVTPKAARHSIDMFGLVEGPKKQEFRAKLLAAEGGVNYRGYVPGKELAFLRRQYAFSLITWADTSEHLRFACPNKFFEAIADGVPPIVTPHPQCKQIVDRYDCGIVMEDWSEGAFLAALRDATEMIGTDAYAEMVENCRHATRHEINWSTGFARVAKHLPARFD